VTRPRYTATKTLTLGALILLLLGYVDVFANSYAERNSTGGYYLPQSERENSIENAYILSLYVTVPWPSIGELFTGKWNSEHWTSEKREVRESLSTRDERFQQSGETACQQAWLAHLKLIPQSRHVNSLLLLDEIEDARMMSRDRTATPRRLGMLKRAGFDINRLECDEMTTLVRIRGQSAGIARTLFHFQNLENRNITENRIVGATGSISNAGVVGPVGGYHHKLKAAEEAGAHLFITPRGAESRIKEHREPEIPVEEVGHLLEALVVLCQLEQRRHCDLLA